MNICAAIGCGEPREGGDRVGALDRHPPRGCSRRSPVIVSWMANRSAPQMWPIHTSPEVIVRDRVGRVGADERLLLLEQRERLVELGGVGRCWPSGRAGSASCPNTSCQSSSIEMCRSQRWSQSALRAGRRFLDPGRVVADARRPPHVRDRVLVARVVARVRPTPRPRLPMFVRNDLSSLAMTPRSTMFGTSTEIGKLMS